VSNRAQSLISAPHAADRAGGLVKKTRLNGPSVVITVSGDVDLSNAGLFDQYIHRAADEGDHPFVLCLLDTGFLVTQGIHALLSVAEKWASKGVKWVVVASATGIGDFVENRARTQLATAG